MGLSHKLGRRETGRKEGAAPKAGMENLQASRKEKRKKGKAIFTSSEWGVLKKRRILRGAGSSAFRDLSEKRGGEARLRQGRRKKETS